MIQVTYQKNNGEIFDRIRSTYLPYRVGDITSMGWKVLDIKYRYKDKFYSLEEYNNKLDKLFTKSVKRIKLKNNLLKIYKELNYSVFLIILLKLAELVFKKVV